MDEKRDVDAKRDIVDFVDSHLRSSLIISIVAPIFFAVLPVVIIVYFYQQGYSRAVQNYFSWSNWFSSVIAFFAYVVVLIAAYAAMRQLKIVNDQLELVRTELKASSYSQTYSRLDTIHSLFIEHLDYLPKLRLTESELNPKDDFGFLEKERHMCHMIFTNLENVYYQWKKFRVLDDEDWIAWKVSIKRTFDIDYVSKYWEIEGHKGFTDEFQKVVKKVLDDDSI